VSPGDGGRRSTGGPAVQLELVSDVDVDARCARVEQRDTRRHYTDTRNHRHQLSASQHAPVPSVAIRKVLPEQGSGTRVRTPKKTKPGGFFLGYTHLKNPPQKPTLLL